MTNRNEMVEVLFDSIRVIARHEVITFSNQATAAPYREPPELEKAREGLRAVLKEVALLYQVPLF